MIRRILVSLAVAVCTWAGVTTPAEYLGFQPGQDYKLADFAQISGYFRRRLDKASDRLRLVEFGASSFGRPMYVAFISAPENLKHLDRYREINRRLALGLASPEEARRLAREGKAIVWIDSGLRRNVGTPHELAPLPKLYQKYAGHDNNRDWFMLNLQETRNVARLLYHNQHQHTGSPARIFVPPYAEPLNPNIPAAVVGGINLIGAAIQERFAREGKPGVLSYQGFDAWWNGGLRTAPDFHNMHGILTETAAAVYATPRVYEPKDLPTRFRNGLPAREPSVFYPRPWRGGRWGVREAIDYMLTADFAILDLAASRPETFLRKAYELARAAIEAGEKGSPFAYVVPADQWDRSSALEMLRRLAWSGVRVKRARTEFRAAGKIYPAAGRAAVPPISARPDGTAEVSRVTGRRGDKAPLRRRRLDAAHEHGSSGGPRG